MLDYPHGKCIVPLFQTISLEENRIRKEVN